jgi:quinolinate synthase
MVKFAQETEAERIIIGTESGIIHRLKQANPHKSFFTAGPPRICVNMKKITPASILDVLQSNKNNIEVPKEIADPAKNALDAMLRYS